MNTNNAATSAQPTAGLNNHRRPDDDALRLVIDNDNAAPPTTNLGATYNLHAGQTINLGHLASTTSTTSSSSSTTTTDTTATSAAHQVISLAHLAAPEIHLPHPPPADTLSLGSNEAEFITMPNAGEHAIPPRISPPVQETIFHARGTGALTAPTTTSGSGGGHTVTLSSNVVVNRHPHTLQRRSVEVQTDALPPPLIPALPPHPLDEGRVHSARHPRTSRGVRAASAGLRARRQSRGLMQRHNRVAPAPDDSNGLELDAPKRLQAR